jgi:hypothetical protein
MEFIDNPIEKASADKLFKNFLVYADSGAGKTVFAASAKRVLFVAPEDAGMLSALEMGYEFDKILVPTWDKFVAAYEWLYDNSEILANYDWIVVDSLTKLQSVCLRACIEAERESRMAKGQDLDEAQIQNYGKLYILMEKLVLGFNDLPCNVLYTALARQAEDPDGNEFMLPMLGSNKPTDYRIAMKIAAEMTSYGYFKVEIVDKPTSVEGKTKKVKQRSIIWEDTGTVRGKDRTTRLTPKTVLPSKNALAYVTAIANGVVNKDDAGARNNFINFGGARREAKKAVAQKIEASTPVNKPVEVAPTKKEDSEDTNVVDLVQA